MTKKQKVLLNNLFGKLISVVGLEAFVMSQLLGKKDWVEYCKETKLFERIANSKTQIKGFQKTLNKADKEIKRIQEKEKVNEDEKASPSSA